MSMHCSRCECVWIQGHMCMNIYCRSVCMYECILCICMNVHCRRECLM